MINLNRLVNYKINYKDKMLKLIYHMLKNYNNKLII